MIIYDGLYKKAVETMAIRCRRTNCFMQQFGSPTIHCFYMQQFGSPTIHCFSARALVHVLSHKRSNTHSDLQLELKMPDVETFLCIFK